MLTIGICNDETSSACLFKSGELIAAVSEERFSRIKNDERYPYQAINWLLKHFKISKKDITAVCFISNACLRHRNRAPG